MCSVSFLQENQKSATCRKRRVDEDSPATADSWAARNRTGSATMRNHARATSCPLCGTPLGAIVDARWVAMSLDEYRDYALTRLDPNQAARLSPGTCIGCHSTIKNPKPDPVSLASPAEVDGERTIDRAPGN